MSSKAEGSWVRDALTRRTVPFVPQLTPTDCGAASLASVLAYHQKDVPIHELRNRLGGGRNGVTAKQILTVARGYGFSARGVQITPDKLPLLPVGSILHWDLMHFVVFGGLLRGNEVRIIDPGIGVRTLSMEEVTKSLSGVALVFEPGESFVRQKAKRSGRFKRYARWIFGVRDVWSRVLVASLVLQLIALSLPALTGLIVDKVVPRVDMDLLSLVGAVFLSVSSFYFLSTFLRSRVLLALRTKVEVKISFDFLEHLLDLPYAFFQQRTTGDLIMRMSSQAVIRELLTTGALSAMLDGALVLIYLVLLLIAAPWLALIAVIVAVLQGTLFAFAGRKNARMMVESLAAQSQVEAYQVEMLGGIETLKAMGATDRAHARWSNLYVDALNRSIVRGELEGTFASLLGTLRFIGPVALMLAGAYQVIQGQLTLGVMLSLSSLGSGFLDPIANLVSTAMTLSQLKGYMERIEDVLDTPRESKGGDYAAQNSEPASVTVNDVSFSYASEPQPTLRGVTLSIEAGQCVAIVGGSGAGKSTLARLLAGLYEPASGSIAFDGVELPRWNLAALRERLGIVTQDTRLFSGSLLENVRLFDKSIGEEEVVRACQLACLHDAICEMPMGYDTMLSDGGSSLSGGQRQRLSLARALVRRPRVLVLDEATSALDTVTEREVQGNLRGLNCTRVIVAHRLSTIVEADRIVVLSAGKVVAHGTHAELLENSPDYRALVTAQGGSVPADIDAASQTQTNIRPRGLPPLRNISAFGGPRIVPPNMRS